MKLGSYIQVGDDSLRLVLHRLPGDRSACVEFLLRNSVVRVMTEDEYTQKSSTLSYCWWWVPVMTMNRKIGWVIFCHGIEKESHFEYCGK